MFTPVMLEALRRGTTAFIATKPTTITLSRSGEVEDGAGGFVKTNIGYRDPIVVSLLEPSSSGYQDPSRTPEGTNTLLEWMLLAEHDADIALSDTFTVDGYRYTVVNIMHRNGYEVRAKVTREAEGER